MNLVHGKYLQYNCPDCSAHCTFEAMEWCISRENCPLLKDFESGKITDKRPEDFDPSFSSVFTYVIEL